MKEAYEYWFARMKGITADRKKMIRRKFHTAEEIYNIEETELGKHVYLKEKEFSALCAARRENDIYDQYQRICDQGIRMICFDDADYPKRLEGFDSMPYALYVKGKLPCNDKLTVAVVGARRCTHYGEAKALEFGEILGEHGIQTVSGMARGIDGAGHRGTLNGGGESFAVLASGVDICYPREHIGLYTDLQKHGGILSEQPPGTKPFASFFPARNRLISALSDIVLVLEAKEKSGSLITADMALEMGKDVYAMPGAIDSELSLGCHLLIRQGADILISPQNFIDFLMESGKLPTINYKIDKNKTKIVLESAENLLYSNLDFYPKNLEQLRVETGLSDTQLFDGLMSLRMRGMIEETYRNYYVRKK